VNFGNKVYDANDGYPDFTIPLARAVAAGEVTRGSWCAAAVWGLAWLPTR
jgi:hypothetical protein